MAGSTTAPSAPMAVWGAVCVCPPPPLLGRGGSAATQIRRASSVLAPSRQGGRHALDSIAFSVEAPLSSVGGAGRGPHAGVGEPWRRAGPVGTGRHRRRGPLCPIG